MDFLKKIKSKKRNKNIKEKAEKMLQVLEDKINNTNENIVKKCHEQYSKNIVGIVIGEVEKEIVNFNLRENKILKIGLDKNISTDIDIDIDDFIKRTAKKSINTNKFLNSIEYKELLFKAIYFHFKNEEQLSVFLDENNNIINISLVV